MINLGIIDILLLIVLVGTLFQSLRTRNLLPFFIVLIVILLIEFERLIPGTLAALGNGIRSIDAVNEKLPHVQISPIISIKP